MDARSGRGGERRALLRWCGVMRLGSCLALALAVSAPSGAHESDASYLRLRVRQAEVSGEWEIHLRDARIALGLSGHPADEASWSGLRDRASALADLFRKTVTIRSSGGACPPVFEPGFARIPGRDYALLRFRARCPGGPIRILDLEYALLLDADPRHRGFFSVEDDTRTHVGVFSARERAVSLDVGRPESWRPVARYLREGVRHIGLGTDHVLFLLALLLPAPLRWSAGNWEPRTDLREVAREVVGVVTAFTVAHSVTLAVAVLGAAPPGARWIESLIALSVFAAAWNNVRPIAIGRPRVMAFGFGLVHGFGFAGALTGLGLPYGARGLALLGFNLGVEAGQLALVAVAMPGMLAARHTRAYRELGVRGGSLVIAWVAAIWTIERVFDVELVSVL